MDIGDDTQITDKILDFRAVVKTQSPDKFISDPGAVETLFK